MCFVSGGIYIELEESGQKYTIFYDDRNSSKVKAEISSNLFGCERICEKSERRIVLSILRNLNIETEIDQDLIDAILRNEGASFK